MRMDPAHGESAADWLARAPADEIRDVIGTLGEERFAGRIARAITEQRAAEAIDTTGRLAQIVAGAVRTRERGKHTATRTFQAIRMHINAELPELSRGLAAALRVLAPGGRLAVISFHSLEDRMVKQFMRREAQPDPAWARLPIAPPFNPSLRLSGQEIAGWHGGAGCQSAARSAILRVAERLDAAPVGGDA